MQKAEMRGVDVAFERLQPVAFALGEGDLQFALGQQRGFDPRQRRGLGALAHIDPDEAVALGDLVGLGPDLFLVVLMRRRVRHVDAIAVHVEFPAVIDAAEAVLLVAAEEQRGAAMRAAVIHDADPAGAVAKRDQPLAEQQEAQRRAVALQFRRHRRRQPVLPHQLAHRGAGADPDQILAVLLFAHRDLTKTRRSRARCPSRPGCGSPARNATRPCRGARPRRRPRSTCGFPSCRN